MKRRLFYCLLFVPVVLSWVACSQKKRSIALLCEKGTGGNYEIKWEIYPEPKDAQVEIYASDNDSIFFSTPSITAKSDDYIAAVNLADLDKRHFFKLKVDKTWSSVVTNRFFNLDNVQNFRDMGGYYTVDGHQVRWGKLFRSGSFRNMTLKDLDEIKKLHIKTHIDIRVDDVSSLENPLSIENYYRIPMGINNFAPVIQQILDGQFMRGDAVIYTQDAYKNIVDDYTGQLAQFFDYLCDESNYPVVFACHFGKEQTGLAAYFLLYILGVPAETIEDDYMASNKGISKQLLMAEGVADLPESSQEALSLVANTDIAYLRYALSCIRKKRGTLDAYLEEDLKLSEAKRDKLKEILLY